MTAAAPVRVISMPPPTVTTVKRSRVELLLEPTLFYGTFALLAFGPLAFGAVQPWAIFTLEVGAAVLFLAWSIKQLLAGAVTIRSSPAFAPMLLFLIVASSQLLSGGTAYRYATATQIAQYLAYGALSFVALQALDSPRAPVRFARLLSWFGFAVSVFAIIQGFTSPGKLYWVHTPSFGGWIYGPYVNHNHYAGLMEMLAPIPLVLCLTDQVRGAKKFLFAFASLLMAATIFTSGSRGGMIAFAIEAALIAALLLRRSKSPASMLTASAFTLLLAGLIAWTAWSTVASRWQEVRLTRGMELSVSSRLAIDKDALRMFAARPMGWGLGNFPTVYPQFRSFFTDMYVNAAHNDYLQMLVETGVLGAIPILWFLFVLFRAGVRLLNLGVPHVPGFSTSPNDLIEQPFAVAALIGCTGVLVHSLVDFNLQIPANAALFYVLSVIATSHPRRAAE